MMSGHCMLNQDWSLLRVVFLMLALVLDDMPYICKSKVLKSLALIIRQ